MVKQKKEYILMQQVGSKNLEEYVADDIVEIPVIRDLGCFFIHQKVLCLDGLKNGRKQFIATETFALSLKIIGASIVYDFSLERLTQLGTFMLFTPDCNPRFDDNVLSYTKRIESILRSFLPDLNNNFPEISPLSLSEARQTTQKQTFREIEGVKGFLVKRYEPLKAKKDKKISGSINSQLSTEPTCKELYRQWIGVSPAEFILPFKHEQDPIIAAIEDLAKKWQEQLPDDFRYVLFSYLTEVL